jgi:hypothetical protein
MRGKAWLKYRALNERGHMLGILTEMTTPGRSLPGV